MVNKNKADDYLDLVALGNMADMVSLRSKETKHLIWKGFQYENIRNPFIFCKWKYQLLPNGKVINIPSKDTIYRQRRKLTKMTKKNINIIEIKTSIISFCAYC